MTIRKKNSRGSFVLRHRDTVKAVEKDHVRLLQILHGTVCQSLTGAALTLRTIRKRMIGRSVLSGKVGEYFQDLEVGINRAVVEAREMLDVMRPAKSPTNLARALTSVAADAGLSCSIECPPVLRLDRYTKRQLVEIVREMVFGFDNCPGVDSVIIRIQETKTNTRFSMEALGNRLKQPFSSQNRRNRDLIKLRVKAIGGMIKIGRRMISVTIPLDPR